VFEIILVFNFFFFYCYSRW